MTCSESSSSLEVPYALDLSSDDESSSCGFTSPGRQDGREPLRAGDVIAYTCPVFTAGAAHGRREATVVGIDPTHSDFPLVLDNCECLPSDTFVQRIGEFYKGKVRPHPGRQRPITSFLLKPSGGTTRKILAATLQQKAMRYKGTMQSLERDAMRAYTGASSLAPREKEQAKFKCGLFPTVPKRRSIKRMEKGKSSLDSTCSLNSLKDKKINHLQSQPRTSQYKNADKSMPDASQFVAVHTLLRNGLESCDPSTSNCFDDSSASSSTSLDFYTQPLSTLLAQKKKVVVTRRTLPQSAHQTSPSDSDDNIRLSKTVPIHVRPKSTSTRLLATKQIVTRPPIFSFSKQNNCKTNNRPVNQENATLLSTDVRHGRRKFSITSTLNGYTKKFILDSSDSSSLDGDDTQMPDTSKATTDTCPGGTRATTLMYSSESTTDNEDTRTSIASQQHLQNRIDLHPNAGILTTSDDDEIFTKKRIVFPSKREILAEGSIQGRLPLASKIATIDKALNLSDDSDDKPGSTKMTKASEKFHATGYRSNASVESNLNSDSSVQSRGSATNVFSVNHIRNTASIAREHVPLSLALKSWEANSERRSIHMKDQMHRNGSDHIDSPTEEGIACSAPIGSPSKRGSNIREESAIGCKDFIKRKSAKGAAECIAGEPVTTDNTNTHRISTLRKATTNASVPPMTYQSSIIDSRKQVAAESSRHSRIRKSRIVQGPRIGYTVSILESATRSFQGVPKPQSPKNVNVTPSSLTILSVSTGQHQTSSDDRKTYQNIKNVSSKSTLENCSHRVSRSHVENTSKSCSPCPSWSTDCDVDSPPSCTTRSRLARQKCAIKDGKKHSVDRIPGAPDFEFVDETSPIHKKRRIVI